MQTEKAATIITRLALGVDPSTGQELSQDTVLNRVEVIRALVLAADILRRKVKKKGNPNKPARAGAAWEPVEDEELRTQFEQRVQLNQMAHHFGRTRGAITAN